MPDTPERRVADCERLTGQQDEWRLTRTLNLIASENVLSKRARALLSSDFNHRYAEGHPGERYYQGTKHIDTIEAAVRDAMRRIFECKRAEVRTVSGTVANEAVISAWVKADDVVLVNTLASGGHISHQRFGALGRFTRRIEFLPRSKDGYGIDLPAAKDQIATLKPKLVILGKSLILFPEPVREIAEVCREHGVRLMYDGAHVLGLIAGGQFQQPLKEGAELITGSTHKTFFGPQRGVVLSNLDDAGWKPIDKAAFPGSVSNHHLMTLPPLWIAAEEMTAFGRDYAAQVVKNARALGRALLKEGVAVEMADAGFTSSHQIAVNVAAQGGGSEVSERLEGVDIICNKNMLPHDPSTDPRKPSGLRFGAQELTRWGMGEGEMAEVAALIAACILKKKDVAGEVHKLRGRFTTVRYSFDS